MPALKGRGRRDPVAVWTERVFYRIRISTAIMKELWNAKPVGLFWPLFIYFGHELIDEYRNRIINVHPALIPSFWQRVLGLRVHEAALEKGVKVTGATVHFVNEIPDGGDIILQKAVEVLEGDTPQTLQRRVMEQAEWVLLPQAVSMLCE